MEVLVKRTDGIKCKHHVNQLCHNIEISQVMTESENEMLAFRDFGHHFANLKTFKDYKPRKKAQIYRARKCQK